MSEEIKKDEKPKTVKKPAKKKEASYFFVKSFKTSKKEYKIGAPCYQEHPKVIEYLLTNKIIK